MPDETLPVDGEPEEATCETCAHPVLGLSWEQAGYIAEHMNDYGVPHSQEIILP